LFYKQVPHVYVKRDWYKDLVSTSHHNIHKFVNIVQDTAQVGLYHLPVVNSNFYIINMPTDIPLDFL